MAAEKKDIIKPFRLTQQEADRLKKQAQESGMKESEYIRLLLSQKPNDYPEIRILLKAVSYTHLFVMGCISFAQSPF